MNKNELLIEFLGSDGSVRLTNSRRFKSLLPLLRQLTQDCPERFTDPERLSVLHLGYIPTCKVCSGPSKLNGKHWQTYCSRKCIDSDEEYIAERGRKSAESFLGLTEESRKNATQKIKDTNLKKYGVENPFQSEEVKKKIRQTNLERYGVENPAQAKQIKEKMKKTCRKKYGTDYSTQSEVMKEKTRQTNLERYGVKCTSQIHLANIIDQLESQDWWNQWDSFGEVRDYLKNKLAYSNILKRAHKFRPEWDFSNISSPHQRINTLLDSLGVQYETNTKQIIAPLELDIFLPEYQIAIEVNGLYWHSELAGNKPKDYHLNKFLQCQAKGIRLLQFWDSEINNKWSDMKKIIKCYLGLLEYSGSVVEEGSTIIYNDNRFPWDYSELGFTLVEQTEPRCLYTDYQNVYEEPGNGRDRIWDCGFSVYKKPATSAGQI